MNTFPTSFCGIVDMLLRVRWFRAPAKPMYVT